MNIEELYNQLNTCLESLEDAGIDDDAKLDLELLRIQIKRQIRLSILDPIKDLQSVTAADLSKLSGLIDEVNREIANEAKRAAALKKVIGLVKVGANAAGIPV